MECTIAAISYQITMHAMIEDSIHDHICNLVLATGCFCIVSECDIKINGVICCVRGFKTQILVSNLQNGFKEFYF